MGTKISEFASATTPLTGSELVPIVQGGSTVKTTVDLINDLAPVQSVAGRTGAVVIATTDVTGFTAAAAAAAPVQSVAGRTGAVTLGISDVASLQTALDGKLSTSGGVVSANSSTDALRITQTGTGNALVVEDSANPDSTPFVVDANGNVGVGTSAPITVAGQSSVTINGATSGGRVDFLKAGTQHGVINCAQTNLFDVEATGASTALRLNTNGVERLRIDASGNVGVGTAAPVTYGKFAVAGADNASLLGLSAASGVLRAKAYNTLTSCPSIEATNADQSGYSNLFLSGLSVLFGTGTTERMRVDTNGYVGIGTSAPGRLLSLSGPIATLGITSTAAGGNTVAIDPPSTAANGVAQLDIGGANSFRINTNSTERMRFDSVGNVGIGITSFGTNAFKVIGIGNGTAPTTSPAGMGQLYVENGALKYRGSSGTVTTLAPA